RRGRRQPARLETQRRVAAGDPPLAAKSRPAARTSRSTRMSSPEQWTHPDPGDGPAAQAAQPSREQVIAGLRATTEGGAELTQLLTPEGERISSPQFDHYVDDIDAEALRGLYRDMVLVRRADRECNAMQ